MKDEEYLAHIDSAIRELKTHTAGMAWEAYAADSKTQRAVERNLQIVGDAAHKLSEGLKRATPRSRGTMSTRGTLWSITTSA